MRTNDSGEHKPKIILISPTAGTLAQFERAGFLGRQVTLIKEYGKRFQVEYYTSDITDYSGLLGVNHHPLPIKLNIYGLRHLLFWIFLVVKAPAMNALIRTFGVEIPTLPLVKILSGQKVIAGYEWDYASTTRANYGGIKKWLANFVQACGFRGADLVISTTDRLKGIAEMKYHRKAVVIPNFVDFNVFGKNPQKEDHILYAGRLHWSKGVDVLLSAFKEIVRDFPGCRLTICGTGDAESALRQKVAGESIPNVEFLGPVKQDKLAHYMARAKAFVLPTLESEGHPRVLIEAMASGTACIATRVPGSKDVITDNVNGLLVEPRDSGSIFAALSRILGDDTFRRKLESEAYAFAQRYGLADVFREEVSLINSFVNGRS
jgi:glycosyltransferase involved in cell wall biosynthesis